MEEDPVVAAFVAVQKNAAQRWPAARSHRWANIFRDITGSCQGGMHGRPRTKAGKGSVCFGDDRVDLRAHSDVPARSLPSRRLRGAARRRRRGSWVLASTTPARVRRHPLTRRRVNRNRSRREVRPRGAPRGAGHSGSPRDRVRCALQGPRAARADTAHGCDLAHIRTRYRRSRTVLLARTRRKRGCIVPSAKKPTPAPAAAQPAPAPAAPVVDPQVSPPAVPKAPADPLRKPDPYIGIHGDGT